jgi:hypothetical protein
VTTEKRIQEALEELKLICWDPIQDGSQDDEWPRRILSDLIAGEAEDAARYRALRVAVGKSERIEIWRSDTRCSLFDDGCRELATGQDLDAAVDALRESARVGGEEVGRG